MAVNVLEGLLVSAGPYLKLTGLSAAKAISPLPNGATYARIQAVSQTVRYRDDGVDPTAAIGMRLLADAAGEWFTGDISKLRFIEETASAEVNILFYKPGTPGL